MENTIAEATKNFIADLPNGFEADWTMVFGGYETTGDDLSSIPESAAEAREKAEAYWSEVRADIEECRDLEQELAKMASEEYQNWDECKRIMRQLLSIERKYGDAPTYDQVADRLADLFGKIKAEEADASYIHLFSSGGLYGAIKVGMPEMPLEVGFGNSAKEAAENLRATHWQSADWWNGTPETFLDDHADDHSDDVEWNEADDDLFEFDGEYYTDRESLAEAIAETLRDEI